MNRRRRSALGILFCLVPLWVLASSPWVRAEEGLAELSTEDWHLITRIDAHLNEQRTLRSRFIQSDGLGEFLEGTLYWRRPDQARFEYDPPSDLLLVATGNFFIEVDFELEQVTHYPQIDSVANYLLRDNLLQNPALRIVEILEQDGLVSVRTLEREEPENGEITLIFDADTLDLQRWIISTPDRHRTTVTLYNQEFNPILEDTLFRFRHPKEWNRARR